MSNGRSTIPNNINYHSQHNHGIHSHGIQSHEQLSNKINNNKLHINISKCINTDGIYIIKLWTVDEDILCLWPGQNDT